MNYDAFMEPVTWFLTGMEKHSDEDREELHGNGDSFIRSIFHQMSHMLTPSQQVAMNELSNHDHSRFLTRTNHMVGRIDSLGPEKAEEYISLPVMREAVAIQMTWVGAPHHLLRRRGRAVRLHRPGQPQDLPLGQGEQRADRLPQGADTHTQELRGVPDRVSPVACEAGQCAGLRPV